MTCLFPHLDHQCIKDRGCLVCMPNCGGAGKFCFYTWCLPGTFPSLTLLWVNPNQNGLLLLRVISSKGPPACCWSKVFGESTSAPENSPAFSPFLVWLKEAEGHTLSLHSFRFHLVSLPLLLLGLRLGWVPAPVLINNKSMAWNLMQLRGLPVVDLE